LNDSAEVWMGELAVNSGLRMGSERLRLLFTNSRLLVDHIGKRGAGAAAGTNILGQLSSALEDLFKSGRESAARKDVRSLTPDRVLIMHRDNFAVDYKEVVGVTVVQTVTLTRITILTGGDKFEFSSRARFENIVQQFKNTLRDKLTVQRL
jgi:hypothetical protein